RPIEAVDNIWIDELTWMEVRDAIAAGKTTAIIATGGIEPNGPYLVTGKHNVVLRGACEAIARKLGNALCAPIIAFVPEGSIEPQSGHMRYPGTISVRAETYRMLLEDVAGSLEAHGMTDIVFIGDSGGNQEGLEATAAALNARWTDAHAYYIPEFYRYADVERYMEEDLGFEQPIDEGLHDDLYITSLMMVTDPASVRYDQRVKAGKATINGASIVPKERTIELGRKLMEFRAEQTIRAIRTAMAAVR
ncbi:MAG: creatininase family protein, partial [Longimicrobiales bacterium]